MSDRAKRILVVDDERDFTDMMKYELERDGTCEVLCLNTGLNVKNTVKQWRPDVVFLDLIMPLVDGTDVYLILKTDEKLKHVPVVLLTALAAEDEPPSDDRPDWTLAKPVSRQRLLKVIEEVTSFPFQRA